MRRRAACNHNHISMVLNFEKGGRRDRVYKCSFDTFQNLLPRHVTILLAVFLFSLNILRIHITIGTICGKLQISSQLPLIAGIFLYYRLYWCGTILFAETLKAFYDIDEAYEVL